MHPLDVIKTRLQVQKSGSAEAYTSISHCVRSMYRAEGYVLVVCPGMSSIYFDYLHALSFLSGLHVPPFGKRTTLIFIVFSSYIVVVSVLNSFPAVPTAFASLFEVNFRHN